MVPLHARFQRCEGDEGQQLMVRIRQKDIQRESAMAESKSIPPGVGKITQYIAYLGLSALSIVVVVVVSVTLIKTVFPHMLSGSEIIDVSSERYPNYFRNLLEVLFFTSNVVLLSIAIVTVIVARFHAKEAENARIASIYMEISSQWSSDKIVDSRMYIITLSDRWKNPEYEDDEKAKSHSVGEYIRRVLESDRKKSRTLHNTNTAILIFMEDLGVLCKKRYVREEDIFDFIASPIILQMELLQNYVENVRKAFPTAYENALALSERAKAARAARLRGAG
jgi:hypothetical protein